MMKKLSLIVITFIFISFFTACGSKLDSRTYCDSITDIENTDEPYIEDTSDNNNTNTVAAEDNYKIIPVASGLQLEDYSCLDFSMKIPHGWKVEATITEAGMFHAIRVYDPSDSINQIMFILKAEPVFANDENRLYFANIIPAYSYYPVMSNASVEEYFKVFSQYALAIQKEYVYSTITLPDIQDFNVKESYEYESSMSSYLGKSDLLYADFKQEGVYGEGMFTADIVPMVIPGMGTEYYMAYNTIAVTARKDTFQDWKDILIKSLSSLNYSQSFISYAMQQSNQATASAQQIGQALSETSDTIIQSWEARNKSQDIISQKQSDATLGYERVYDIETNKIYKAENGFTDIYTGSRYKSVTDDNMYTQPVSGYIERQ